MSQHISALQKDLFSEQYIILKTYTLRDITITSGICYIL